MHEFDLISCLKSYLKRIKVSHLVFENLQFTSDSKVMDEFYPRIAPFHEALRKMANYSVFLEVAVSVALR